MLFEYIIEIIPLAVVSFLYLSLVIVYLLLNTVKDKVLLFDFFKRLSADFSNKHVSPISSQRSLSN